MYNMCDKMSELLFLALDLRDRKEGVKQNWFPGPERNIWKALT